VTSDGHEVRLHFSDPDLNFWEKAEAGFGMNGMVYIECMYKHGRDGHRAGYGVLVFGAEFGVNFSDSGAHRNSSKPSRYMNHPIIERLNHCI